MRRLPLLFCLLILAVWLAPAPARPALAQAESVPRFEAAPCPVEFPTQYDVDCGYLVVPEQHAVPDGPTLRLALAIFRTSDPTPEPDPVINLAGGPGSNSLDSFSYGLGPIFNALVFHRDVIVFDQRGMGYSEPALVCDEVDAIETRSALSYIADLAPTAEAAHQCYDRLVGQGINIAAFNTLESAADVAAIAPALGYDSYNLYGGSYGTMLGLITLREHPEGIRSAVLEALSPPRVDLVAAFGPVYEASLNRVFEACAADSACNAAYPGLPEMYAATVERLNADPVTLNLTNPANGAAVAYTITGDDFVIGLQQVLYSQYGISNVPLLIAAVYSGNDMVLGPLVEGVLAVYARTTDGAYYAMRCMDDIVTTTHDALQAALEGVSPVSQAAFESLNRFLEDICTRWGAQELPNLINEAVTSDIPVLLLDGIYDPVTAPEWTALAAETLPNSYVFLFPDAGHGVYPSPCAKRVIREFITQPGSAPDAHCIDTLAPIAFTLP